MSNKGEGVVIKEGEGGIHGLKADTGTETNIFLSSNGSSSSSHNISSPCSSRCCPYSGRSSDCSSRRPPAQAVALPNEDPMTLLGAPSAQYLLALAVTLPVQRVALTTKEEVHSSAPTTHRANVRHLGVQEKREEQVIRERE